MEKTKKLFWTGAFVALVISIVTFMGVALSYATPAQTTDQDSNEKAWTVTLYPQGDGFMPKSIKCDYEGWNKDTLTLTLPENIKFYSISINKENPNCIEVVTDLKDLKPIPIYAIYDKDKVDFSWGSLPAGLLKESQELYPIFEKKSIPVPADANLATVAGIVSVNDDSNAEKPLSGAEVWLENRFTAEVFAKTVSGSKGEFVFDKIPLNDLAGALEKETYIVVVNSPGYTIDVITLNVNDVVDVQGKEVVLEQDSNVDVADINFYGADHHANYVFSMELYFAGKLVDKDSMKFSATCLGLPKDVLFGSGADFTIDENGAMNSVISPEQKNGDEDVSIVLNAQPVPEDGYSFDYVDINSQQYRSGDKFSLASGGQADITVNYKATNQIAQTGDAVPFAVLIALGIIAGLSVVAIRKFSK